MTDKEFELAKNRADFGKSDLRVARILIILCEQIHGVARDIKVIRGTLETFHKDSTGE